MTTSDTAEKKPLWLLIEENILALESQDLSGENLEASIQRIAGELDNAGYNVSYHGGNMLQLRGAMNETLKVGRPLLQDFNSAVAAFTLSYAGEKAPTGTLSVDGGCNLRRSASLLSHRISKS